MATASFRRSELFPVEDPMSHVLLVAAGGVRVVDVAVLVVVWYVMYLVVVWYVLYLCAVGSGEDQDRRNNGT